VKQVFGFGGEIVVKEVPAPVCGDDEVIVQNAFSIISTGTEDFSLKQSSRGIAGLMT